MKRSKAISAIAAVLTAGFLLASCTPFQSAKQKKWVDEMEDAFPGDTFEYVGHPSSSIVIVDYDRIQVHSKKYKTDAVIDDIVDKKLINGNLYFIGEQSNCGIGYIINIVVYRINSRNNNISCVVDGCAEAKFIGNTLKVNHPSITNQNTATCDAEYRYKDHWSLLHLK